MDQNLHLVQWQRQNIYIKMGKVKQATINNLSGWLGRLSGDND